MSVMKKILTFFMLLLILCACETRLTDNTYQDIFDFPKYREGVININTHNYMPSMAKEKIGVTNERSSDSEILSRVTEVLKDSLWKDDFGRTIYAQADESLILPNLQRYIFPGSLLRGDSISDCNYTPITATINPITVSVSFPAKTVVGTINHPSLSATRSFVNEVLQQEETVQQNASLNFSIDQFTSYDELRMAFGSNAKTSALFFGNSSSSSEKVHKISKKTGLYVRFVQRNFTIDMDIPSSGSLISGTLTANQTGGYSPVYAASVTYGRMGIMAIETDYTYAESYKIVEQAFKSIFYKKSSILTEEAKKMLNSAEMRIYLLGGDGQSGVQTVNGYQDFIHHISEGGTFSSSAPGVPIYCGFAYLTDNSPVKIKFKINISSDPVYARIEYHNYRKDYFDRVCFARYGDAYLSFYSDINGTIKTVPAEFIKFKYRLAYRYYECYDANWDELTKDIFEIKDEGIIENIYHENSILLKKNLCLEQLKDYIEYVGEKTWCQESGYQLTNGDYYKLLLPKVIDHSYVSVWPEENY